MTEQAIVVRNSGTAPTAPPPAITGLGGALPEVLQLCNAIAAGGELVPKDYRGKPGAVLLAKMWADAHGVDLFTAVQNIYLIQGKPYVSAAMRVALATDAGFELKVIESNREVCTIEVWQHRSASDVLPILRGAVTSRLDEMPAKTLSKDNWTNHPDDMLFADACRKADRRYVKTAAALLDAAQDYADEPDPLDVIADTPEPDADPPVDAEIVEADEAPELTEEDLRSVAKVADLLRAAGELRGEGVALVADIVADQDLARAVMAKVRP